MTPTGKALLDRLMGERFLRDTTDGFEWPPEDEVAADIEKVEAEAAAPLRDALERIAYGDEFSTLDGTFDRNSIRRFADQTLRAANPPAATEEEEEE